MKKLILVLMAEALLFGGLASAEDTSFSLGVKAWNNSWKFEEEGSSTIKYDAATMVGPSLTIKNSDLFLGLTLLVTAKDYKNTDADPSTEFDTSRTDLDFIAGYMITPRLGIYMGFKSLQATLKVTMPSAGISEQEGFDIALQGPGIGILGNYPINDVVALYGNLGFLSLNATSVPTTWWLTNVNASEPATSETLSGASVEIGAAFVINEFWSANVGIKSQSFTGDDSENKFSGLTGGVTYTF